MKKLYVLGGTVIATAWVTATVTVLPAQEGAQVVDVDATSPVDVGWRVIETETGLTYQAPPAPPPTIGPNEFYFLWTMPEQVAIDELRDTDRVVKLFMRRLDDPRTTEIMLADPAVQAAVRHTVEQLVAKGVIKANDSEKRIATLLAGGRL